MKSSRTSTRHIYWLAFLAVSFLACLIGQLPSLIPDTPVGDADLPSSPHVGAYSWRKVSDLSDQRISESSGLGASRRYPRYLWTHNDSGDGPRLFLLSPQGNTVTVATLDGARNRDWEDMAVAGTGSLAWVYAGDIGDNLRMRANIAIYRFREPQIALNNPPQTVTVPWARMTLTYPDGPHDAEALLATAGGYLVIATKDSDASRIYMTPRPFAADTTQKLVQVGTYTFQTEEGFGRMVTGGDLSPDGKRLVLRTYTRAYEWTLPVSGNLLTSWQAVWKTAPRAIALPATRQGEAICYSADGQRLSTTSEGSPAPLYELTR